VPPSADGRIVEEVQRGYTVHDCPLRPAKVIVGQADRDLCSYAHVALLVQHGVHAVLEDLQ
jgi:hypothetical protein